MIRYILWRIMVMIPTLVMISMLIFTIIELRRATISNAMSKS